MRKSADRARGHAMLAVNAMQLLDAMHSVDALNATLVAPDLRQEALKDATRYLELLGG
jgi:hypothetical protein